MMTEIPDSALMAAAGLAAIALLVALLAWSAVYRLRRQLAAVTLSMGQLEQATLSTAKLFATNDKHMEGLADQLRQLGKRQELLDAASAKSGFKQAIALTRHGASVTELIETCGVSQGEARLIQTLHGINAAGRAAAGQLRNGTASQFQPPPAKM